MRPRRRKETAADRVCAREHPVRAPRAVRRTGGRERLQEREGFREMRELREMLAAIRSKGMAGTTPGDHLMVIAKVVQITGVISAAAGLIRIIADLAAVAAVLKEETAGRTIALKGLTGRIRILYPTRRLRIPKSTGRMRSAGTIRSAIRNPRRTSSTKRMM